MKKKVEYSFDAEKAYLSIGGVFGTIPLRGADLQDICDRVFFYYQLDRKPKHGRSEQRGDTRGHRSQKNRVLSTM